jgi:O-succinylbenzoic acid--CoA ligase
MRELVALDMPGGPGFVAALGTVWDAGNAALVLDPRLPPAAARAQLAALRPSRIIGPDARSTAQRDGIGVEDGDALVVATSGTTGTPRAAVLTHAALRASARLTTARLGVDPARHRWLACLPLAHIGGLAVVVRSMLTGTPLTVHDGFDSDAVTRVGRLGAATHVALVATALGRVDPALFERVLLGGSAVGGDLAPNVVTTYGMTETGSGVVYDGIPLDGVEIAIGTGEPGNGEAGEILVRSPTLLRCYRDGTDPTIVGPDGRGRWLPTGDGGRLGPDGRLTVAGRLREVIVTGAEKVWPALVEQVIGTLAAVREVAVWKRPDPEWGERVVAWIVPTDPADPPRLETVREVVGATLAPWAAPKEIELVGSLPRTPTGKVRRVDLV